MFRLSVTPDADRTGTRSRTRDAVRPLGGCDARVLTQCAFAGRRKNGKSERVGVTVRGVAVAVNSMQLYTIE
eukprot:4687186-Prymnesium_polylepis.1